MTDDDAPERRELATDDLDLEVVVDLDADAPALDDATDGPDDLDSPPPTSLDETTRRMNATDRRHAVVLALTTLTLVAMLAGAAAVSTARSRAEQAAVAEAAARSAAATLATQVAEDLTDVTAPARAVRSEAGALARALEEHLILTDRSDEAVDQARDDGEAALRRLARELRTVVEDPLPTALPEAPVGAATDVLRALGSLRAEADALALEVDGLAERADVFGDTVRAVTAALRAHGEVVDAQGPTDDPEELVLAWEAERAPLEELALVARVAAVVPGLEAWAGTHERFATASLLWIDEAVGLLEAGELDTYNARLDEVLGGEDPFGFTASVMSATADALEAPVLVDLDRARTRADLVLTAAGDVSEQLNDLAREATERPQG